MAKIQFSSNLHFAIFTIPTSNGGDNDTIVIALQRYAMAKLEMFLHLQIQKVQQKMFEVMKQSPF